MNCNRIEELCARYYDGDLSDEERRTVDEHVAGCAACRQSLEAFAALETSLGSLKEDIPSWKRAEARFFRRPQIRRRRLFVGIVFNAPVMLGLLFVALGLVLLIVGDLFLPAIHSLGPRSASAFDGAMREVVRLFTDAAAVNPIVLAAIYGFLAFALMCGTSVFAFRFGRK